VGGLAANEARQSASRLDEAPVVRACVAAAAVRERDRVGRGAELLDELVRGTALSLDAVRVQRVDEREPAPLAELARCRKRLVEAPAYLEHDGTERSRLRQLPACDRALRDQNDRAETGPSRVCGSRGRRVSGRGTDHG